MVLPGGAVKPAMYAITGFVTSVSMNAAAFSSSSPPISPTMTTYSVCGSSWNLPSTSMNDERRNRDQVIALGTERTGGRRDDVLAFTAAAPKMQQLASELLQQYVVTYVRPEQLIPPEKIDITVTKTGLTARAGTRTREAGAR